MKFHHLLLILLSVVLVAGCAGGNSNEQAGAQLKQGSQETHAAQPTVQAAASSEDAQAIRAAGLVPVEQAPVAPEWTMATVEGGSHQLSDFRGKVIILDFWDTWCPPCKKEIPGFIELQKEYGEQGLVVIGAAFGRDGRGAVAQFAKEWGINYPVVLADGQVNRAYGGINSIPTTFIIDRQGRARAKHVGYVEKSVFERQVKALL